MAFEFRIVDSYSVVFLEKLIIITNINNATLCCATVFNSVGYFLCLQTVRLPMIVWLLRNRFLYQVHSYVTLLPPADMSTSTTIDSRTRSDISMSDGSTDAGSLTTSIFVTRSDTVNLQSLSLSGTDTMANNGSTSEGRRVDTDTKDHTVSSKFLPLANVPW